MATITETEMGADEQERERASREVIIVGNTREEFAADAQRLVGVLADRLTQATGRQGKLNGVSKQRLLKAIERMRRTVLEWPAWARRGRGATTTT